MINLLFVCMGNICRSPSAEAVMNALIEKNNLQDKIKCGSAGTIGYHTGESADPRMMKHAAERGYNLTSIARQIEYEDLSEFDYILTMDSENFSDVLKLDNHKKYYSKIMMMTDFCRKFNAEEVPDPYFGGDEGFEFVLDLLEDSCGGLLKKIIEEKKIAV